MTPSHSSPGGSPPAGPLTGGAAPAKNAPADNGRANHIHYARVILAEARRRRPQRSFHVVLMRWARNSRLRAAACRPAQGELF